jgi:membrane protein
MTLRRHRSTVPSLWSRGGLSWKELGLRLWRQIWEDELLGRSAELAYFFLFSIFPLLLFLTTLLGYLAGNNPSLRLDLLVYLARVSPSVDVTALLHNTLHEITTGRGGAKLSLSLAGALWLASNGMLAVTRALNAACGLKETRRFWKRRPLAIVLTIAFAVLILCALGLIFYGGAIGEKLAVRMGIGQLFATAWNIWRWPLILVFVLLSFEMVYNYAPNLGKSPNRQWGTPGAVTGVALWLLASFGLRAYLTYRHPIATAYGSLWAVILLLIWFYLTGLALLMGGEVNSEIAKAQKEQRERWETENRRADGRDVRPHDPGEERPAGSPAGARPGQRADRRAHRRR